MAQLPSTASQVHRLFVSAPMGDQAVTSLAGIGPVIAKKLNENGFSKASNVFGQYLLMHKDEQLFVPWLMRVGGANTAQAKACFSCLKGWCDNYFD